ncbi:glycosyltransferase family 4 protein [Antribacter gilvus]|uniref:glycosyltransferase family 4 protein n=1 Tax=Antribacter gilvus TaxID=2304675 RepID=UPI000F76F125|nr:glycosyltransferase family 4 protein [Antribacter gilvus]
MRVGIVCPYSFDAPGGVQFHVRDLAEALMAEGHDVEVLAPASDDTPLPDFVTPAGRAVPVPYNGSVARLTFGPMTASKVRRWLEAGEFDVLHLHEPMTPSLSMLALWQAQSPVVATFHSSLVRSRALQIAYPLVRQSLEKIAARIAVSEDARRTLVDHLGGDAVVIPNGVFTAPFATAEPRRGWSGTPDAPTIAFLGRIDEPRKGLSVLVGAVPRVLEKAPGARFLVAGRGEDAQEETREALGPHAGAVEFLGGVSDEDKARLLRSVDLYVAPQTGGESFGIVLVEAMSAGAVVVASDLGAFHRVLDDGAAGALFRVGDSDDLAATILELLADPVRRDAYRERAAGFVQRFDWATISQQVLAVYEMAIEAGEAIGGHDDASARFLGLFPRDMESQQPGDAPEDPVRQPGGSAGGRPR